MHDLRGFAGRLEGFLGRPEQEPRYTWREISAIGFARDKLKAGLISEGEYRKRLREAELGAIENGKAGKGHTAEEFRAFINRKRPRYPLRPGETEDPLMNMAEILEESRRDRQLGPGQDNP